MAKFELIKNVIAGPNGVIIGENKAYRSEVIPAGEIIDLDPKGKITLNLLAKAAIKPTTKGKDRSPEEIKAGALAKAEETHQLAIEASEVATELAEQVEKAGGKKAPKALKDKANAAKAEAKKALKEAEKAAKVAAEYQQ